MSKTQKKETGLLAIFENPDDLVSAIKKIKGRLGLNKMEAFTPFPVHGVDHALGLKRSWIPWATLVIALSGWCLGFIFQAWTSAVDWPLVIGGKPFVSWPAFIPVTFESMVLVGGVATTFILFAACGLPRFSKPILDPRLTNDRFGLFVDRADLSFNEKNIHEILKESNVQEIKNIL